MRATLRFLCPSALKVADSSASEQLATLRRDDTVKSGSSAMAFPSWGVLTLPPLMGKFRGEERARYRSSVELKEYISSSTLDSSPSVEVRSIIVGSRSPAYIQRQLEHTNTTKCIVLDHDLAQLTECAFQLRPKFGHNVSFVRCDVAFALWALLPQSFADVIVFAMPVPHASRQASHRRLLTRDMFHLCHPVLKCRQSPTDSKGIVMFSDVRAYAEFAAGQLDECKLLVPWARKRPDVFARWLPDVGRDGWGKHIRSKRTVTVHEEALHCLTAAKSGETTAHGLKMLDAFDFRRRHYDALHVDSPE